jgi:hypothetical protein
MKTLIYTLRDLLPNNTDTRLITLITTLIVFLIELTQCLIVLLKTQPTTVILLRGFDIDHGFDLHSGQTGSTAQTPDTTTQTAPIDQSDPFADIFGDDNRRGYKPASTLSEVPEEECNTLSNPSSDEDMDSDDGAQSDVGSHLSGKSKLLPEGIPAYSHLNSIFDDC